MTVLFDQLFETTQETVHGLSSKLDHQITAIPSINGVQFDFPQWYQHYRHASDEVQERMEDDLYEVLSENPQLATVRDQNGDLPLHHVLVENHGILAPVSLEVVRIILLACPASIKVADRQGLLPIHLACRYGGHLSSEVVIFLAKLWPESLGQRVTLSKYKRDMLPIHISCEFGSLSTVKALAEVRPRSLMVPNGNGDLPLHIACKGYNVSSKLVKFLVKAYPEAVLKANERGDLPLHIVCNRRSSITVVRLLAEQAPRTIKAINNKGELPLHCVCNGYQSLDIVKFLVSAFGDSVRLFDDKNMLPIHHALSTKMPVMETVNYLFKQYSHAVQVRTKDGYLPLHQACRFGSKDAIKYLISIYPDAIRDCENAKNMLPLQLYCRNKNPSKEVVNAFAQTFPESVRTLSETTRVSLGLFRSSSEQLNRDYCGDENRNQST